MTLLPFDDDPRKPVYARSGWEITLPAYAEYLALTEYQTEGDIQRRTDSVINTLAGKNKRILNVRSISPYLYNCVGMVFACRRAWIHIDEIYNILRNDGYVEISFSHVESGDIVVYTRNGKPEHVGLVTFVRRNRITIDSVSVLSKWGKDGEIEHYLNSVPEIFGQPAEFWSEKRKPYVVG